MTEDSGTQKSLLVGGVAFVVGSLLTLQILGPEVPKPEPRFVDITSTFTKKPEPARPEPVVAGDVALDPIPATTTADEPVGLASIGSDTVTTTEAPSVFEVPEVVARNDRAQVLGLGQDPGLVYAPVTTTPAEPVVAPAITEEPSAFTTADAVAQLDRAVARTLEPENPEQAEEAKALSEELVDAVNKGVSDDEIEALINDAVDTGKIFVPAAVFQVDGQIDTRALLLTLVEKAVDGGNSGAKTAVATLADQEPVFLRGNARQTTEQAAAEEKPLPFPMPKRVPARRTAADTPPKVEAKPKPKVPETYVVRPGDSLAAISFRFYGTTSGYMKIFQANQDVIFDPSVILVGQTLKIPG